MENNLSYASFKDRVIAFFIDIVILTVFSLVMQGVYQFASTYLNITISQTILDFIGGTIMVPTYFIIMLYFYEASLGNMIMKIKLISENGEKMHFLQIVLREVVGKLFCVLTLGYGYFWIIADKRNQGFHDKLAKVLVIYDR